MKRANQRQEGRGALELIEEAVHLLRTSPASVMAAYYMGTLPFVLGFLLFWADMSRSPFARSHIAEASLGLGALFVWMKFWQSVFTLRLRARFSGEPQPALKLRRCGRILLSQLALQPTGLFMLPLAAIPALPLAWVYAFYQNATAFADNERGGLSTLCKKSWRQAALWPRQNHLVLTFMSLFGFFVFLNIGIACAFLPDLLKMLFGIESVFTRGGQYAMLNTTFLMALCGLTYLCVDPILKSIYTLRCFYGESLDSGEDLKAELKLQAAPPQSLAAMLALMLMLAGAIPALAEDSSVPAAPPSLAPTAQSGVSPKDLDRAISDTIQQRKYVWRMPREDTAPAEGEPGIIARFFERVSTMLRKWVRAIVEWLDEWLRKLFRRKASGGDGDSGYGWIWSLEFLLYGLLAVVLATTAILLMRWWRKRNKQPGAVLAQAVQPLPDLMDENVGADQLPGDEWIKLAREMLLRGEFRLALRAFYLSSLAHLAERNLISLARFKSNRDYELELRRRAHALPALPPLFAENVSLFDRSWYGDHEVTHELVDHFATNVERIKGGG
jgi:hypothetical protein